MRKKDYICPQCNQRLWVGAWPFCPHESTVEERAQRFKPIVVFKSKEGKYRYPMRDDTPVPKGYERVELTNRRQIERFEREINQRERAEYDRAQQTKQASDAYLLSLSGHTPDAIREGLKRLADSPHPEERARATRIRELIDRDGQKPSPSKDPGFHIEIMHYDRSNREPHNDALTGWKDRHE